MRIVGGRHRGRPLLVPDGWKVRPTGERAREALFNILMHGSLADRGASLVGKRVLDAFAGTGAFGLEALSRGAAEAAFIESDPEALALLRRNVAALGEEGRSRVFNADATRPPRAPAAVALAFLDPPYASGLGPPALTALAATGWFEPKAIAILEVAARETFEPPALFTLCDERRYGAARFLFLRLQERGT